LDGGAVESCSVVVGDMGVGHAQIHNRPDAQGAMFFPTTRARCPVSKGALRIWRVVPAYRALLVDCLPRDRAGAALGALDARSRPLPV
jgi:hypothetical protein